MKKAAQSTFWLGLLAGVVMAGCSPAISQTPEAQPSPTPAVMDSTAAITNATPDIPPARAAQGAGITWPPDQCLPSFAAFDTLDVIDMREGIAADELNLFTTLQGTVNRAKPRIYLVYAAEEGATAWLDDLENVKRTAVEDPWSLLIRYKNEIRGIVISNPDAPETINLATTIAGVEDGIVASPELAVRLTGEPYNFPVLADLRKMTFESRADLYRYAYETYGAKTHDRLTISLDPKIAGNLRDYAVALRGLVIWLDPRVAEEEVLLDQILRAAAPGAPFVGYFPNPTNGGEAILIRYLSQRARPSFALDVFQNATVFGGTQRGGVSPALPAKPELENKIYGTFFISDGDNLQYIQHKMRVLWQDPRRGQVPIGWTFQPALADVAPLMLRYYQSSATANDVLVAGPSGLGYTYPNDWPEGDTLTLYARQTEAYMRQTGLRVITLWDSGSNTLNPKAEKAYGEEMPTLLGVTHQNWSDLELMAGQIPQIGLHPAYGDSEYMVERSLSTAALASGWDGSAPHFLAAQVNAWEMTPTELYNIMTHLQAQNPEWVFVRPDHFFMLAREAQGLPSDPMQ